MPNATLETVRQGFGAYKDDRRALLPKTKGIVYVAGPYTKGDVAVNVRNAIEAANRLADDGWTPFVPHLTHFWHLVCPRPYEFWCELDNHFLQFCDLILRLPGESAGADREVKLAAQMGIPCVMGIEWFFQKAGDFTP